MDPLTFQAEEAKQELTIIGARARNCETGNWDNREKAPGNVSTFVVATESITVQGMANKGTHLEKTNNSIIWLLFIHRLQQKKDIEYRKSRSGSSINKPTTHANRVLHF